MPYNSYSPAFSAIILYIIIILIIAISKPNFIYDHENNKFREFGFTGNKTFFTLLTLGIILSFVIYNFITLIMPQRLKNISYPYY